MPRRKKLTKKLMAEIGHVNAQIAAMTPTEKALGEKRALEAIRALATSMNVRIIVVPFYSGFACTHRRGSHPDSVSWNGKTVTLCKTCLKKRQDGAMIVTGDRQKKKAAGAGK